MTSIRWRRLAATASLLAIVVLRPSVASPTHPSPLPCDFFVVPGQLIQPVINIARSGDEICILGGASGPSYLEPSTLDVPPGKSGLTLRGIPVPDPLNPIEPARPPRIRTSRGSCTIAVRAWSVTIASLDVVGNRYGPYGVCFVAGSAGSRAENVSAYGHSRSGILIESTDTIELAGVTASENGWYGVESVGATGIKVVNSNTVHNGGSLGVGTGIALIGTADSLVKDTTASFNNANGIYMDLAPDNAIEQTAAEHNGATGMLLKGARNAQVLRSSIDSNGEHGIEADSAPNVRIRGNSLSRNASTGIYVTASSGAVIRDNDVTDNETYGITAEDSPASAFDFNTVEGNEIGGMGIVRSPESMARFNSVSFNGGGISVSYGSDRTVVRENVIDNNRGTGILSYQSTPTISNNWVRQNQAGIWVAWGNGAIVSGNTVQNSRSGIYLFSGSGNIVTANTVSENAWHGIHLHESPATVSNNQVYGNGGVGIELFFDDSSTVSSNTVNNNQGSGISMLQSRSTIVTQNTIRANTGHGIHLLDGSSFNRIRLNRVESNSGWQIMLENRSSDNTILENTFIGTSTGYSDNPISTNTWFTLSGFCGSGNFWSDVITEPDPNCPLIHLGGKAILGNSPDPEIDQGPLLVAPV